MSINTNVYGAQNTWLNALNLSTGAMVTKCANFTGGDTVVSSSSLGVGNTANKTPHNTLIDRSISLTALGTESIFSHITYWKNSNEIYTDNEIATEFYFCTNDNSAPISNTSETIYTNSASNFWKTYKPTNNKSDILVPITKLNPKKILYLLQVMPVNANGAPAPFISGVVDNYRFMSIVDYANNARNIRTDYPYIQAARLVPRVDNSNTTTPSRSALSGGDYEFGMAINREFTAIPDNNLKINYCQFINIYDKFNIPLWGHRGYFNQSADYNVILANPDDIQTGVIEYSREYWVGHLWDNDFYDYLVRQAACLGVFVRAFAGGGSPASLPLNNDSVILGLLDDQGIGHGDYTRGEQNMTNPIYNWESYNDSPYDWTKPVDPTHYDKTTVFGNNDVANTFIKYWALSPAGVMALCDNIYSYINSVDTTTDDITKAITKTFYTNNPLDVIVGLKRFPFDIVNYVGYTGQSDSVKLGNLSTNIAGYPISGQYTVVNFGSYDVFPKFDDTFLDFMPYTYFELIVPFCGSVRLDPALFMGKKLQLKMIVDLYTGACTCYILANSLCIDSVSGNCSIDIPVSGIQSADFQNSVQNAISNVKNAKINQYAFNQRGNLAFATATLSGGSLGSPYMAVAGNVLQNMTTSLSSAMSLGTNITNAQKQSIQNDLDVSKAEYDLQHVQTPFNSVGSQSAANSFVEEMQARLIIYRPKFLDGWDSAIYGKTVGFACMRDGKVSSFSGYTVGNINLDGIDATNQEKQMIAAAFANGVYL